MTEGQSNWLFFAVFLAWIGVAFWLIDPWVRKGIGRIFHVNIGRRNFRPNWFYAETLPASKALVLFLVEMLVQFIVIVLPFIVLMWIRNR